MFAYSFAGLFTGAVFTEKIFGWHGMGEWFVQGINTQDINIVVAITVFAGVTVLLAGAAVRRRLRRARSEGAGDMTEPVTTDSSTTAKSGVDVATFASRRTLVLRRFLRNKPAVVSLAVLVLLFIGCYALPPLLPYNYSDLDYFALQQPPSTDHWFGTNGLGQDLLAQTLRGMQKSMLIGVCVAFISTLIAATVGTIAGYFGGWRDRAADVACRPDARGAQLPADHDRRAAHQGRHHLDDRAAVRIQLDDQLPHRAWNDDEPA